MPIIGFLCKKFSKGKIYQEVKTIDVSNYVFRTKFILQIIDKEKKE
jgi:hypothetical protein